MRANILIIFLNIIALQIQAQSGYAPPSGIQANVNGDDVLLNWSPPDTANSFYLSWDNGLYGNSIGLSDSGYFAVAARWEADMLAEYEGYSVTKLGFFLPGTASEYTARIWEGSSANTVVLTQPVEGTQPGDWTYVYLDTPVPVNTGTDLWVGYDVLQSAADFGAGTDLGPAVTGYGDMINYQGLWTSMALTYGLDFNFNIRVYLSGENGENIMLPLNKMPSTASYQNDAALVAAHKSPGLFPASENMTGTLLGYNVYRDGELLTTNPITDTALLDPAVGTGIYYYGVTAVYEGGESNAVAANVQIGDPQMVIMPDSISGTYPTGGFYEYIITIYNEGDVDLTWLGIPSEPWLFLNPPAGILAPGQGFDVQLFISTGGLSSGEYDAEIVFSQNNSQNPTISLPVHITAVGSPGIMVTPSALGFGDVVLGETLTAPLNIYNTGTDTLLISEVVTSSPEFTIDSFPQVIPPFMLYQGFVSFEATTLGEITGNLTISSNDITNPELDIPLSAYVYLPPPVLLQATVDGNDVTLTWDSAVSGQGEWLQWDNGQNFTALGYNDGGSFQYAVRWDAAQIAGFDGQLIAKVAFFPRGPNTQYTVKAWKGDNASIPLLSQGIGNVLVDQWNEVVLVEPLTVDGSQELWIGLEVTQPAGDFPAGADEGPATAGYGDMINIDGTWTSMTELLGIDHNWNLKCFVMTGDSAYAEVMHGPQPQATKKFYNAGAFIEGDLDAAFSPSFANKMTLAQLLGYNVYRDDQQLNGDLLSEMTYTDTAVAFGIYSYGVTAVYDLGESPQNEITVQVGAPQMVLAPASLADTLDAGETAQHVVTISNEGDFTLEWFADASADWITLSENAGTVLPGESMEMIVTLTSAGLVVGYYPAGITFEVNNANQPLVTLPVGILVTGDAQLVITPDTLDFGITPVGGMSVAYVSISNIGNDFIFITEMTAEPYVFTTQNFPVYLGPGGYMTIGVEFTPDSLGTYTGLFTAFTDNPDMPLIQCTLVGTSLLPPPINLDGIVDSTDVVLDWQNPLGANGNYLQHSDNQSWNAIGYSGGGTFLAAAKFGPEDLMMFNGAPLTVVGFIPWSTNANFTLKVWLGENADELVLSQPVGSLSLFEWNDYQLDYPIPIEPGDHLWIGYEVDHEPDEFPAGLDLGPAVSGKGDLLSVDGQAWETLEYYGLSYNWNIRGFVDLDEKSANAIMPPVLEQPALTGNGTFSKAIAGNMPSYKSSSSVTLLGYNVYRDGALLNDSSLVTSSGYTDPGLEPGTYLYTVTAVYDIGESDPASLEVLVEEPVMAPEGWTHHHTAMSHVIHIPTAASQEAGFMAPGDWIGVFYEDEGILKCGGSIQWSESDSLKLVVYGDDPLTQEKEGFDLGEWMTWKVYMSETGETHVIEVDYNVMMPNYDGLFDMLGISALTAMDLTISGSGDEAAGMFTIHPNPTTGAFRITGASELKSVTVMDMHGNVVAGIDLAGDRYARLAVDVPTGIYSVVIHSSRGTYIKKLIVQ